MYEIVKHQASPRNERKIIASSPVKEIIFYRPRNLSRILEHYSSELLDENDYCVACKQPAKCVRVNTEDDTINVYPCCNSKHKFMI